METAASRPTGGNKRIYIKGQPLVLPEEEEKLSLGAQRVHNYYMEHCNDLEMFWVAYKKHNFHCQNDGEFLVSWEDLFGLYNFAQEDIMLEVPIIRSWTL